MNSIGAELLEIVGNVALGVLRFGLVGHGVDIGFESGDAEAHG
jgi:hypothetical protein